MGYIYLYYGRVRGLLLRGMEEGRDGSGDGKGGE